MGPAKLQEKGMNSTYQAHCQSSFKEQEGTNGKLLRTREDLLSHLTHWQGKGPNEFLE